MLKANNTFSPTEINVFLVVSGHFTYRLSISSVYDFAYSSFIYATFSTFISPTSHFTYLPLYLIFHLSHFTYIASDKTVSLHFI
jgi:hypothetical protein